MITDSQRFALVGGGCQMRPLSNPHTWTGRTSSPSARPDPIPLGLAVLATLTRVCFELVVVMFKIGEHKQRAADQLRH